MEDYMERREEELKLNILKKLKEEFPSNKIKSRKGPKNKRFSYIPEPLVKERLDSVLPLSWSWAVKEYKLYRSPKEGYKPEDNYEVLEVAVLGRLTLDITPEYSVYRDAWGGSDMDKGSQPGDPFKIADSNAFKKAALKFGVGAYLALAGESLLEEEASVESGYASNNPFQNKKVKKKNNTDSASSDNPFLR